MILNKLPGKVFFSLFAGGIASWFIKEDATPLLLLGKNYEARSVPVQVGILILLATLISFLLFFLITMFEKIFWAKLKPNKWKEFFTEIDSICSSWVDALFVKGILFLRENNYLIIIMGLVSIASYGFELFNFNITIDEEFYATQYGPTINWLLQGRWGMYLLNKFVMPYTVIPFVPLFVALMFHMGAILLLLEGWRIQSKIERSIFGAISLAFPLNVYIYMFSTINYGIGIGLFCVALSLFVFTRQNGVRKLYAFIPSVFAIAVYQGLIPVLIVAFTVYILLNELQAKPVAFFDLLMIIGVHLLGFLGYYFVHKMIILVGLIPGMNYVDGYFDVPYLIRNFSEVVSRIWKSSMMPIYYGGKSVYSFDINGLGALLIIASIVVLLKLLKSVRLSNVRKIFIISLFVFLILTPFASGLFMRGIMYLRFFVSLIIAIPSIIILGTLDTTRVYKTFVSLLTITCLFQFFVSSNHLFAASHMALQADRVLAGRVIAKIEEAQSETAPKELRYMEIIGYYPRPSTYLIPQIDTVGVSFFQYAQGSVYRIVPFLQTVGYIGVEPLPIDQEPKIVAIANSMPAWPDEGSVKIIDDIVLVKFGPYSDAQKSFICSNEQNKMILQDQGFCK